MNKYLLVVAQVLVFILPISILMIFSTYILQNQFSFNIIVLRKISIGLMIVSIYSSIIVFSLYIYCRIKKIIFINNVYWKIYLLSAVTYAFFFIYNPFYFMNWLLG